MSKRAYNGRGIEGGRKKKRKLSNKEVSALLTLQKNPEILQQYQQQPEQQRKRRELKLREHRHDTQLREEFLTRCLVQWSVADLVDTSELLLEVMAHRDPNNYEETLFADNTTIRVSEGDTRSFADYYIFVFQCAKEAVSVEPGEDALVHHGNLLRACFIIAFAYEARVRRFIMAQHSIHHHYMQTRPPTPEVASRFIKDIAPVVDDFLYAERITILEMVEMCCTHWVSNYMTQQHTTQTPLTKNIEVRT